MIGARVVDVIRARVVACLLPALGIGVLACGTPEQAGSADEDSAVPSRPAVDQRTRIDADGVSNPCAATMNQVLGASKATGAAAT